MIEKICPYHEIPTPEGKCKRKEFNDTTGRMEECMAVPKDATTFYWCKKHLIPLFEKKCGCCEKEENIRAYEAGKIPNIIEDAEYVGTDIRPVFPEEQLLLGIILDKTNPLCFLDKSVWHNGYCYIVDGEKVKLSIDNLNRMSLDKIETIRDKVFDYSERIDYTYFNQVIEKFKFANRLRLGTIVGEASDKIREWAEGYDVDSMMVSFSGGKDSTVVSSLVRNALSTNAVRHFYGDTTLEFESTEEYVKRLRNESVRAGDFSTAKNRVKNFEDLCGVYGPPSRVMRWCCTVFKTGALIENINKAYKEHTSVLSFQGIRKYESTSRSKYERESTNSKIAKQKTVLPIFEWTDFDVWLYILSNEIDFNDAYRFGYTRVGCWCCPNNGAWSEFLSKIYMFDKYVRWRRVLLDFAEKSGKTEPEEYVDGGNWKARQGGNGLEAANASILSYEPCAVEDDTYNYELQIPIDKQLYELFKPFGNLDFTFGNKMVGEVYVLDRIGNPVLILKGRKGTNSFKITIKDKKHITKEKLNCQITKYQMCSGCRACESVCKMGAIRVTEDTEGNVAYTIDNEKCVHCGECVGHFNGGCYMRKVLTIKRGN